MTDRPDETASDQAIGDAYSADDLATLAMLRSLTAADSHRDRLPTGLWGEIELGLHDQQPQQSPDAHPVSRGVRRRWTVIGAAAAVLIGAGATGVVLRTAPGDHGRVVVESAQLSSAGLAGAPSGLRGDAEVIESDRGQVIRVDIGTLRPASGQFLEIWLINRDISGMVSLGTARPDGTYEFPPGLSLADYPVVDVSSEPFDGNPTHSGDSLLRGVLGPVS